MNQLEPEMSQSYLQKSQLPDLLESLKQLQTEVLNSSERFKSEISSRIIILKFREIRKYFKSIKGRA